MRRDYYAVLGIVATAAPREVRQAYRRLARQYSPDVNLWDVQAKTLFEEITEAYRVLSDPVARAMYDQFGMGPGSADALGAGRQGEDVHVVVDVDFADVVRGGTRAVDVPRFSPCDECRATGQWSRGRCGACQGRGVRRGIEAVEVAIPAGVDTGVQIRVRGEGSAGPFGGPRGDLIVNTRVGEHPFFTRRGDSVHCEVPISVWEALQGARVRVPTPSGSAILVVPPGTTGGRMFRLREHGLPKLVAEGAGDLYVSVRIEMPAGLDARTHELVRELERLLPMEPRAGLEAYHGGAR